MQLKVDLELPPELVKLVPQSELGELFRTEIVLRLFADHRIGSGDVTRLLGLTRGEFMDLLRQRGIPCTAYSAQDLAEDMTVIAELKPEIEQNVRTALERRIK